MKKLFFIICYGLTGLIAGTTLNAMAVEPQNEDYDAHPTFLSSTVKPNVLVILDTSTSMQKFSYQNSYTSYSASDLDGYFDKSKNYSYDSSNKYFEEDAAGSWPGALLNWICMRRMDTAKHVLTGGRVTTAGDGSTVLYGTPWRANRGYASGFQLDRTYNSTDYDHERQEDNSLGHFCPYFEVGANKYYIRVKINTTPTGIIQNVFDDVNFGFEIYNPTGTGDSINDGGRVLNRIGDTKNDIVNNINTQDMLSDPVGQDIDTPMAESLYTAAGYFGQVTNVSSSEGPRYDVNAYTVNDTWDPFYSPTGDVSCVKSFVIIISDGEATSDSALPSSNPDLTTSYGETGTNKYMDDVAYWMHTTDIRSSSFGKEVDDVQTITLYTVSTFGGGTALLKSAAMYGGFEDADGDNLPDSDEYDKDGDGDPDNYFSANTSSELTEALSTALIDILEKAAAASAVSVLSTQSDGEGIMVQAYFQPSIENVDTGEQIKWTGYIQSLWLDDMGNMREDTNQNRILETNLDNVVTFSIVAGDTKVNRFLVSDALRYPDTSGGCMAGCSQVDVEEIIPLWEAGKGLSDMEEAGTLGNRHIFTYIGDGSGATADSAIFDASDDVIRFSSANAALIKPFLGIKDNSGGDYDYLGAGTTTTAYNNRASNLINFITGYNTGFSGTTNIRSRLVKGSSATAAGRSVWILGDTVNSSPVSISSPPDKFGVIYSDRSYEAFYNKYRNRELIVYAGANDGMLHAFTSWQYNRNISGFENPYAAPYGPTNQNVGSLAGEVIGTELWAYIPQALLPHLKWLADNNYMHVYFVDLTPKIVDAKIFTPDAVHPGGWGTILVGGLNYGGGEIAATGDFDYNGATADTTRTFTSCYFVIDITEPREPRLLWERTYDDLGFTTSVPSVIRVKDKWFAVFGSGPDDYDGTSTQNGHIYIVDLETGEPYKNSGNDWLFVTSNANAFISSPVALDYGLNFNVDAIYIPEVYGTVGDFKGAVHKVRVPWWGSEKYGTVTTIPSEGQYSDNPLDGTHPWVSVPLISAIEPITAPPALSIDGSGNAWVYFGTGRYITDADKTDTSQQYFYGIKDPFFNYNYNGSYYHDNSFLTLTKSDLELTDDLAILESQEVYLDGSATLHPTYPSFSDLISHIHGMDGWYRSLGSATGERALSKPAILGGVVLAPVFQPNTDICGFGGDSYLYGFYFETGTAFPKAIFTSGFESYDAYVAGEIKVLDKITLGKGLAESAGIHLGKQSKAKGLIQQSTGVITTLDIDPVFNIKSSITSWEQEE